MVTKMFYATGPCAEVGGWENTLTKQLIRITNMFQATGPCAMVGGWENTATYHSNKDVLCNWALCCGGRMETFEQSNLSR